MMIFMAGLLSLVPILSGVYFTVTFLRAPWRKKKIMPVEDPKTRYAILVPACNEARVIERVLVSLKNLDYPAELMDIHVIADNCTDNTAELAAVMGVRVLERHDAAHRTKMHALRWAFYEKGILDAGYDALCIVDADVVVSPGFLRSLERKGREGHAIVAGRCDSLNPNETFVSAFASFLYLMSNRLVNLPLANLGTSFLYYGSGFAVHCDHLRKIGWDIRTLVEDTEFALQTILTGEQVCYCDDAVYATEQPVDFGTFWKQQRRWLTGLLSCSRLFAEKMLDKSFRDRDASAFMGLVRLLLPFNCMLGLVQMAWGPALLFALFENSRVTLESSLMGLMGTLVAGVVFGAAVILMDGRSVRKHWKSILTPAFLPLFFGILSLVCLLKPKQDWELIAHGVKRTPHVGGDNTSLDTVTVEEE